MGRSSASLCLSLVMACSHGGGAHGSDSGTKTDLDLAFSQAQGGAFRANPEINGVLPVRLRAAQADSLEVALAGTAKAGRRLADGSWVVELEIRALADGIYTLEAVAHSKTVQGRAEARLVVDRRGYRFTDWDQVGTADSPQFHHHGGELYFTWTDRRAEPRGGYLQRLDGSGRGLDAPISVTPAQQEVARMHVAFGGGLMGVIHQEVVGEGRRHWVSVLDLAGNVLLEPSPLETDGEIGRFQHVIAYDGKAWVAAWRVMTADGVEAIRWLRFSDQGILAGPVELTRAGTNDPHGHFLPYIQMRIAGHEGHSVVSFTRSYWDEIMEMGINRNQVIVVDPGGEVLERGILPNSLPMPFEFESHVYRVEDELVTLSTASSLADEAVHEPHRVFASQVPHEFPSAPQEWDHHLVLDAPRTRGEMILEAHPSEWSVMAWTDERGRDQPGTPVDKIQVLVAPLSGPEDGFRLGADLAIPHAQVFSGMAKLSAQSLGTAVLLVWVDERNREGQQAKPELFMEMVWF